MRTQIVLWVKIRVRGSAFLDTAFPVVRHSPITTWSVRCNVRVPCDVVSWHELILPEALIEVDSSAAEGAARRGLTPAVLRLPRPVGSERHEPGASRPGISGACRWPERHHAPRRVHRHEDCFSDNP